MLIDLQWYVPLVYICRINQKLIKNKHYENYILQHRSFKLRN